MSSPPDDPMLTPEEVGDRLRVSAITVRLWLRQGKLKGQKVGPKLWRVSEADLAEFLRRK